MRIYIVSSGDAHHSLESSYLRAFEEKGYSVKRFSIDKNITKYVRGASIGRKINTFLPVEAWYKKVNRDLVIDIKNYNPELVLVMGKTKMLYGSIAFLKSILKAKFVLLWQDTLCNLESKNLEAAPLFDGLATYSSRSIPLFEQLNFKNVFWCPLAADDEMHKIENVPNSFEYDITFIGGWRSEREQVLSMIVQAFPKIKMKVFGYYWKRFTKDKNLFKFIEDKTVNGEQYALTLNKSRMNINIIDDTNYPSANMRFFEIPISSSLELCSSCPEQENQFLDKQHMLYFNEDNLKDQIEYALTNHKSCQDMRHNAFELTMDSHTYKSRVNTIINNLL